jgi:hypothetical protein
MWYEETDIIFGLRTLISTEIAYFLFYRKIITPVLIGVIVAFFLTNKNRIAPQLDVK